MRFSVAMKKGDGRLKARTQREREEGQSNRAGPEGREQLN